MSEEPYNPWAVTCLDWFNFLCCPECDFRTKLRLSFENHAVKYHPKSNVFFKPVLTEVKDTKEKIFYCCPECNFKSKDVNIFQIHALKEHPITSLAFFTKDNPEEKPSKSFFKKLDRISS